MLAKLYNAIIPHHIVSIAFTKVIFKPLLKAEMKSNDKDINYMPIAIILILFKLFESYLRAFLCHN